MNDSTAPDVADRIVFVDTPPAYRSETAIILAFGSAYLLPGAMMLLIALWLCLPPAVRPLHRTPAPTTTMPPAEEP